LLERKKVIPSLKNPVRFGESTSASPFQLWKNCHYPAFLSRQSVEHRSITAFSMNGWQSSGSPQNWNPLLPWVWSWQRFSKVSRNTKLHQGENQEGIENTAAIGEILVLAANDVQELDTIMHNKYARNPAKLHAWQRTSRVERAPVREKKASGNPVPNS